MRASEIAKSQKDETEFTSATTNHGNYPNGMSGLPLMSKAGESLASHSAPQSAFTLDRVGEKP